MRDETLKIYETVVSDFDDLKVKGKKSAYTAVNGNMFSFLDPNGLLCVRLSKDDKAAYEAAHGTGPVIQNGSVMNGYVPVIKELLEDEAALKALFVDSVRFARSLKPKPTKRK